MSESFLIFLPVIPEMILMIGSVGLFLFSLIPSLTSCPRYLFFRNFLLGSLLMGVLLTLLYDFNEGLNVLNTKTWIDTSLRETTFSGMFVVDWFIKVIKIIICSWMALFLMIVLHKQSDFFDDETLFCILMAMLGGMYALSANDFKLLFIGIEFVSVSSLILLKVYGKSNSSDIVFRVFIIYGLGSSLLLFGASILYGIYGTTDFSLLIGKFLEAKPTLYNSLFFLSIIFIILGFFSKMLIFPFQGLYKEVAEKVEMVVFIFINFIPRFIIFSVMLRLFILFNCESFKNIFLIFGYLGMIFGFMGTLRQNQIKNILACYAIGNMGMIFIGFSISYTNAIPSIFFLFILSALALLTFMSALLYVRRHGQKVITLNDLSFIRRQSPMAAFVVGFSILSFVNFPPFPGFIPFVAFMQNFVLEEAYITLSVVIFFKLISINVGIKVIRSLMAYNALTTEPLRSRKTFVPLLILGLCLLLIFLAIYADSVINIFSLSETTLKCYGELGTF